MRVYRDTAFWISFFLLLASAAFLWARWKGHGLPDSEHSLTRDADRGAKPYVHLPTKEERNLDKLPKHNGRRFVQMFTNDIAAQFMEKARTLQPSEEIERFRTDVTKRNLEPLVARLGIALELDKSQVRLLLDVLAYNSLQSEDIYSRIRREKLPAEMAERLQQQLLAERNGLLRSQLSEDQIQSLDREMQDLKSVNVVGTVTERLRLFGYDPTSIPQGDLTAVRTLTTAAMRAQLIQEPRDLADFVGQLAQMHDALPQEQMRVMVEYFVQAELRQNRALYVAEPK